MKNSLLIILFICNFSYSQVREIKVVGKVYIDSITVEAAVVSVKTKSNIISGITNQKGEFVFESIKLFEEEDSIKITSSYFGYSPYNRSLEINKSTVNIDIYLKEKIELLDEVVVVGEKNRIRQEINKLSFNVNKNDFQKNTKATNVLNSVPSLSFNYKNGVKIDGIRNAKIYVDGLEADSKELSTIDVSDMEKVEVLYNPSARFGSEFTGGVINIITKKRNELFYKGYLQIEKGALLRNTNITPQLTFKTRKFIFKGFFNYLNNLQKVNFDLIRFSSIGQNYSQSSFRNVNVTQQSGNFGLKYDFSKKHTLFFKGSYQNNDVSGVFNGVYQADTSMPINFLNNTGNIYEEFNVDGIFERKIQNNIFSTKVKYLTYSRNNFYDISENSIQQGRLESESNLKEFTGELTYEILKVKNTDINLIVGAKYIKRKFIFINNPFILNQKIASLYSDFSFSLSEKLSMFSSLYLERASNFSTTFNQKTLYFLPTSTLNYKVTDKANLGLSFSRRLNRPNSADLNKNEILLNPGIIERGNEDLSPQVLHRYSLKYSKSISQNDFFSINTYFESIDNAILQSIIQEGKILVYTKDNIGAAKKYGITLGSNNNLFGKLRSNLNIGVKYDEFENESMLNSGVTFFSTLFLSTSIFNDKVELQFFGSTNTPTYDFISRTTAGPFTNLSASTNMFKDKMNIAIRYSDIFKMGAKFKTTIENEELFQSTNIFNNHSNILISLSYNFGDTFKDNFEDKSINNKDIRD